MPDEIIKFNEELEALVIEEFRDEATPEFLNLLRLGKAAYEHGYHEFITEEKLAEWAERMYKAGQSQKRIRSGNEHGKILINSRDVINAGAYLSRSGKNEGYLSEN